MLTSGPLTLGMRRLAIFDPEHGHQPMTAGDGRYALVFNGAIYNHEELRDSLSNKGFVFRTKCDTEVLLSACIQWGADCVDHLRGMFAFAFWDALKQQLLLARDPFGIKPLYYADLPNGAFLFASELNAIRASRYLSLSVDGQAVSEYLGWLAVPAPKTIYRETRALPPGYRATWCDGRLTQQRYWSFDRIPPCDTCTAPEDFAQHLRGRLTDSIRAHMLADVPVGAFLSGGVDSALIAGLMTKISGRRLKTFSIGFNESGYSELAPAARTATHLGTEHAAHVLTGGQVASEIETVIDSLDQPTGDGINTYYVSKLAKAGGVSVALSGLGGDELFGGYPSFRVLPRIARVLGVWWELPESLRRTAIRCFELGETRSRKLADFLSFAKNLDELGALQRRVCSEGMRRSLLAPGLRETLSPFHPSLQDMKIELAGTGTFERISAWELRTYMADVLLRDSDVCSMRHSLELRVPFIDRPFVTWLWSQRAEFKYEGDIRKAALARAFRDVLPPGMSERNKWGFTLPLSRWMHAELRPFMDEMFSDVSLNRTDFLDTKAVQRLWKDHLLTNDKRQWSRLWSLAVLVAFVNRQPST